MISVPNRPSAAAIAALRSPADCPVHIDIVDRTGSTNADLLARADRLQQPTLLVACEQTAGRGRAGRSWLSDPDTSLTFSLAWPFHNALRALSGLPLAVGVAVADALAPFQSSVQLKWPNDIVLNDAKLGGILVETAASRAPGLPIWAVIGIGLNVGLPQGEALLSGQRIAALSAEAGADRNRLIAALLDALTAMLMRFGAVGFSEFAARWNALHAHAGRQVDVTDNGRLLHRGTALGVDEAGCLLVDTGPRVEHVVAGDVSLRLTVAQ